jgi:hypothetical protein
MKRAFLVAVATATLALGVAPAIAAPITVGSNFSISGVDVVTPTQITFPANGNLLVSNGSFSGLGTCFGCVTLSTITYSPSVASGLIFSITNNALTGTFTLNPGAVATVAAGSPGSIDIKGTGIATLTGFDPTLGSIAFTTQNGVIGTVTFSSTIVAVPEPASIGLFGMAMLGLGVLRRRKAKQA